MNLAHLTYFKTLADTKSYRDTAVICSVSQSTLSNAISGLEKELGSPLIERRKGLLELTDAGRVFYQYVDASLRFLDNGVELVKEHSGENIRSITIGTIFSAQSRDWSQLLYQFRQAIHGDIQINIVQSTTGNLIRKLKNGTIDVAFCGSLGPDSELVQIPYWTQEARLVVNKEHPLSKRESISLCELQDHYLISYELDGAVGNEVAELIKGYDLTIDCLYSDEITLASIVMANPDIMAIACNSWLLGSYGDDVSLVRIEEADEVFRQLYFSYLADSPKPKVVEEFIQLATQQ